jgi:hypothetical protein
MTRLVLALALLFAVGAGARSADLPAGTWTVNVGGKKGKLVVGEVEKDGKVKVKLFDTEFTAYWDGKAFKINHILNTYEGYLVSESAGKGKTKFTLTGLRRHHDPLHQMDLPPPPEVSGWYAQIMVKNPAPK